MTDEQITAYYAGLLIIQYLGLPKASGTVVAWADPLIMNQLPIQIQNAYDIDSAVGVQLDVIGKYSNVKRTGYSFNGPVTLDDEDFRSLIKLAIVKNSSGSSLADIQNLLNTFFPGTILVFDFANMRLGYYLSSSIGSQNLAQMVVTTGLLPKPMGVELASTIYYPVLDKFFGFRTYRLPSYNNSPFNTYAAYQMDWPWLSYSYEVGSPSNFPQSMLTESGSDRLVQENGSLLFI